jgi:tetratricopeptide (TPR) repeat protein
VPEAIELERALQRAQTGDLRAVEKPLFAMVTEGHPDQSIILEALSQGFLECYQINGAIQCLDRWLELQPDNTQALSWRGQTHFLLGRWKDALRDYRQVVELDDEADDTRARLAHLLLTAHQAPDALEHFSVLHQRKPQDPDVIQGLARCQAELGEKEEAIQLLDQLLTMEPNHASGLAERGRLALELNQPTQAEPWLRRSLALAPRERQTLYSLYRCLEVLKRPGEAKQYQTAMLQIDADRERFDELRKALMNAPHDASLRCEMGQILLRNGQANEGRRWLESALNEDPQNQMAHRALADFYESAGNPRQAALHRRLLPRNP